MVEKMMSSLRALQKSMNPRESDLYGALHVNHYCSHLKFNGNLNFKNKDMIFSVIQIAKQRQV